MRQLYVTPFLALLTFALPTSALEEKSLSLATELTLSIMPLSLPSGQCEATITTDYQQRNTLARVDSLLKVADCTVASGVYTVATRIRDENGENTSLEVDQAWQRNNDRDVELAADYPIGENVELLGVRVSQAISRAQAEESWIPVMQKRFELEMASVIGESPELQHAILDYQALERSYDEARNPRRARACGRPDPPRRL